MQNLKALLYDIERAWRVCRLGLGQPIHCHGFHFHPFVCKFYNFPLLYSWIKFHFVHVPYFHRPFFSWWTSGLVPFPCCHSRNRCESISGVWCGILWANRERYIQIVLDLVSRCFRMFPSDFPPLYQQCTRAPFHRISPAFVTVCLLDDKDWVVGRPRQSSHNLHSPDA